MQKREATEEIKEPTTGKDKKTFHILIGIILGISVLFILILVGVLIYHAKHVKTVEVTKTVEVPVTQIITEEVTISGQEIASGLHAIGMLCTAEYYYTRVETFEESKTIDAGVFSFTAPGTTKRFIYSYDGIILAGLDLMEASVEKNDDSKMITITLPPAQIVSNDVDEDSFKLYDEKTAIFNPIEVEDMAESFAELKKAEEQRAIDGGLLERAEKNATALVENAVNNLGINKGYSIVIEFSE